MIEACKDFLFKQKHYADDPGVTLDDARIAPKGAELNDMWRYKLAQILAEGPYVECHPREATGTDPFAAESAKNVLMSIIEDNTNRYSKFRRRVVGGALAVGTWYGMVHWHPGRGPMGDVVFESLEPDQVHPCAGYLDAHDPMCPSIIIERHERIEKIKAKAGDGEFDWKDTDNLWPDNRGRYHTNDEWTKAHGHPSTDDQYAPETITVLYAYYRDASETYKQSTGYRELQPDAQYMACSSCGYKDDQHEPMPDGSLPEVGAPCPNCMGKALDDGTLGPPSYLYRVSREKLSEHRLKYPNGKLCIVAPYQGRVFYEGPWQAPTRSFPLLQLRAYESPYEQMGGCDTTLYWSLQALMDAVRKQMYDGMVTSKPIVIVGETAEGLSLEDAFGQPFNYTAENGQIAYLKNAGMTPLGNIITQFSPQGMNASTPQLYNILSQSFYGTKGTGQISFGADQSKDVAYRSLLLQKESGDIPVEDHKQIWREEEGLFLGCVLDVWVANSSEQRAIRYLGPDGVMAFQMLAGSDIPNVDVIVGTPPQIRQGAIDEVNALTQWAQIPIPSVRRIVARRLNLSPSEVAEVEAELMAQPMQQPGMNGGPPPDFAAAPGGAGPPGFGMGA